MIVIPWQGVIRRKCRGLCSKCCRLIICIRQNNCEWEKQCGFGEQGDNVRHTCMNCKADGHQCSLVPTQKKPRRGLVYRKIVTLTLRSLIHWIVPSKQEPHPHPA